MLTRSLQSKSHSISKPKSKSKSKPRVKSPSDDLDTIEYVDRIIKLYSQNPDSILDSNNTSSNHYSLGEDELTTFLESHNSVLEEENNFEFPDDSTTFYPIITQEPIEETVEAVDAFTAASPSSSITTFEDFITYDSEDENDEDNKEIDNISGCSKSKSPTPINDGTTSYEGGSWYMNSHKRPLDYRCHDKLNLALLEVTPRPHNPPITYGNSNIINNNNHNNASLYDSDISFTSQSNFGYVNRRGLPGVVVTNQASNINSGNNMNTNVNGNANGNNINSIVMDYKTKYMEIVKQKGNNMRNNGNFNGMI